MSEPVKAAGVIARSPSGRILMCRRTDGQGWAFPGGCQKDDEDAAQCAWREFFEETGYRLGDVGKPLMRRTKDDGRGLVDFVTFIVDVPDEFVPRLNHEHSAYGWFDPKDVLEEVA
jgi:8-oxo-dGTP pyrophosphatase MutT (NUDIX family)